MRPGGAHIVALGVFAQFRLIHLKISFAKQVADRPVATFFIGNHATAESQPIVAIKLFVGIAQRFFEAFETLLSDSGSGVF